MVKNGYLTLGQAADMCGWSKGALSKAIKSGKMSVHAKTKAGFQLDPSEVLRVFPMKSETLEHEHASSDLKHHGNSALSFEVDVLNKQISAATLERDREREQLTDRIESLEKMLAEERSERRQLTALLSDQRPQKTRRFFGLFKG